MTSNQEGAVEREKREIDTNNPFVGCELEMEDSSSIDVGSAETSRERKGKAPLLGMGSIGSARVARYKRGVAILDVILRVSAAAASLAATITMGTTQQTLPFFTQLYQFQANYDDLPAFTFFVIAMSIVTGYLVLSLPFSILCIAQPLLLPPRLLLILCDILTAALSTSAASSSASIVYLANNGNYSANWLPICNQYTDFCQRIIGAIAASFIAVLLLLFLLVLSALSLRKH